MSSAILKKLGMLAGVLLVLLVVYYYRQVPHRLSPFAKAGEQVEHILIAQGPKTIDLHKESGAWKVSAGTGPTYAADENLVKTLVSGVKDVQIEDEISDRPDRAAEYEVDTASGTDIRFLDSKGAVQAEGIFGKQAPDISHIYFRYPDRPNVYLARGPLRGELGGSDVNAWRSRQLIDIPETTFRAITIEGKGFKTELVRTSTDAWTLNGRTVEAGPVNALVGSLAHLTAEGFIDPAVHPKLTYEALSYARVRIQGTNGSVELHIGDEDFQSKHYPVSTDPQNGLAWLAETATKSILQKPSAFKEKK